MHEAHSAVSETAKNKKYSPNEIAQQVKKLSVKPNDLAGFTHMRVCTDSHTQIFILHVYMTV